jgi:hypothetical protein
MRKRDCPTHPRHYSKNCPLKNDLCHEHIATIEAKVSGSASAAKQAPGDSLFREVRAATPAQSFRERRHLAYNSNHWMLWASTPPRAMIF